MRNGQHVPTLAFRYWPAVRRVLHFTCRVLTASASVSHLTPPRIYTKIAFPLCLALYLVKSILINKLGW